MKIGTDGVLLGAWAPVVPVPATIIDAGCGSGLIALMMAQRTTDPHIIGVELDAGAAADARVNVASSPWHDRITIAECDILTWSPPAMAGPLSIVSNPPFFTEALRSPGAGRALARHGTDFGVESLIAWASTLITGPDDRLSFIAPSSRDSEIDFHLAMARLNPLARCSVVTRQGASPTRTLWTAGRESTPCHTSVLDLRSPEFITLTKDFYLDK